MNANYVAAFGPNARTGSTSTSGDATQVAFVGAGSGADADAALSITATSSTVSPLGATAGGLTATQALGPSLVDGGVGSELPGQGWPRGTALPASQLPCPCPTRQPALPTICPGLQSTTRTTLALPSTTRRRLPRATTRVCPPAAWSSPSPAAAPLRAPPPRRCACPGAAARCGGGRRGSACWPAPQHVPAAPLAPPAPADRHRHLQLRWLCRRGLPCGGHLRLVLGPGGRGLPGCGQQRCVVWRAHGPNRLPTGPPPCCAPQARTSL